MRRALIGHTGFVGTNLDQQLEFSHRFNSKNFQELRGQEFDEVVCAGVQAQKWWANQHPADDWQGIERLLDVLSQVRAGRFILISTVDVFKHPTGAAESTPVETEGLHPYGLHRFRVEQAISQLFSNHHVLRLPGLFGKGLKKNLIFDLLSGKDLSGFDERSAFQFYHLAHIGRDLERAVSDGPSLIHFAVEPVSVADVVSTISGETFTNRTSQGPLYYDMQTDHAAVFGQSGRYLMDRATCLQEIAEYAEAARKGTV